MLLKMAVAHFFIQQAEGGLSFHTEAIKAPELSPSYEEGLLMNSGGGDFLGSSHSMSWKPRA